MYWLSVSTISALVYFYCKGKKALTLSPPKEAVPETAAAPHDKAGEMPEDSSVSTAASGVSRDQADTDPEDHRPKSAADRTPETAPVPESETDPIEAMASLADTADPWLWHQVYTRGIETAYRKRRSDDKMSPVVLRFGERYVERFPRIKTAVIERIGEKPVILPFKYLAMVLDDSGAYDQAARVCRTALSHGIEDGTRTGFQGRLQRIMRKKEADASGEQNPPRET